LKIVGDVMKIIQAGVGEGLVDPETEGRIASLRKPQEQIGVYRFRSDLKNCMT
jgi:hypothetical protein